MFWASRVFPANGWFEVQYQFDDQWERAGEPADMMLVYADEPGHRDHLCVGLPDRGLLCAMPGSTKLPKQICHNL